MARKTVPIEIEEVGNTTTDTVQRHPAFGQISVGRVSSGGRNTLYGSSYSHQYSVRLTIAHSELHRSLSNYRPFEQASIIEIEMTEQQWAALGSSMNIGGGVQCTLRRIRGQEDIPDLPPPEDPAEPFMAEFNQMFADLDESLEKAILDIGNLGVSKAKKAELLAHVQRVQRRLRGDRSFVADQFGEFMEESKEKLRHDLNAYAKELGITSGTSNPQLDAPQSTVQRITRTRKS